MRYWLTLLFVLLPYTLESADEPARMPSEWKVDMERPDWYHHRDLTFRRDDSTLEIEAWGGECWMLIDMEPQWLETHVVYDLGRNTEWGFWLPTYPKERTFSYRFYSDGFQFCYQPPLTAEEQLMGTYERPDTVIGSYAVYHADCANDFDNRKWDGSYEEYKVGKAFHIYRPKAIDAEGWESWCLLDIDTTTGLISITLQEYFVDAAVWPVFVDPNIGYDTEGASYTSGACGGSWHIVNVATTTTSLRYTASAGDKVTKAFASCASSNVTESTYVSIFHVQDIGSGNDSAEATLRCEALNDITVGNTGWDSSAAFDVSLTADTTYCVGCQRGTTGAMGTDFDAAGTGDYAQSFTCAACSDPWCWTAAGHGASKYSLYYRYETGGGGADSTIIGVKP